MSVKYKKILPLIIIGGLFFVIGSVYFLPRVNIDGESKNSSIYIAPHKAVYKIKLISSAANSGINDVNGEMLFTLDDVCDAWTNDYRFKTEYYYAESPVINNNSHYVSYESKYGKSFSFSSKSSDDSGETEEIRGYVKMQKDGSGKAVYSLPKVINYDLEQGYTLPTAHTIEIIRRAQSGGGFFNTVLFDGTDEKGPVEVTAFISKKLNRDEVKAIGSLDKNINNDLLTDEAWNVRLAIFPLDDGDGMTPSYEMSAILQSNGIITYSVADYGNFKVEQKLTALEKPAPIRCN